MRRSALGHEWTVSVDRPFACALVPMRFYRSTGPTFACAVMTEVNRGLYMDEQTGAKLPEFERVRKRVLAALTAIADATKAR